MGGFVLAQRCYGAAMSIQDVMLVEQGGEA